MQVRRFNSPPSASSTSQPVVSCSDSESGVNLPLSLTTTPTVVTAPAPVHLPSSQQPVHPQPPLHTPYLSSSSSSTSSSLPVSQPPPQFSLIKQVSMVMGGRDQLCLCLSYIHMHEYEKKDVHGEPSGYRFVLPCRLCQISMTPAKQNM